MSTLSAAEVFKYSLIRSAEAIEARRAKDLRETNRGDRALGKASEKARKQRRSSH